MAVSSPAIPQIHAAPAANASFYEKLNSRWHERALQGFHVIVLAHWGEHLVQAYQIYVMGWPRPKANGILGLWYPWLIKSEALHYGYALVMLIGIWVLRKGFTGGSHTWWTVALVIQFWHHIEHFLLIWQATFHHNFWGKPVPCSVLQLVFPASNSISSTTRWCSSPWSSPCTTTCSRPKPRRGRWCALVHGTTSTSMQAA